MGLFDKFKKAKNAAERAQSKVNSAQNAVENPGDVAEGKLDQAQAHAEGKAKSELRNSVTK